MKGYKMFADILFVAYMIFFVMFCWFSLTPIGVRKQQLFFAELAGMGIPFIPEIPGW